MQKYADINNDSGIDSFEIKDVSITVLFKGTNKLYIYSYSRAGQDHVEQMKKLALAGDGLNAYINENVKFGFDR